MNHTDHEAEQDAIATSQMLGIVILSAGALACAAMIGIACFAACHKKKSAAVIEGGTEFNALSRFVKVPSDLSRSTNLQAARLAVGDSQVGSKSTCLQSISSLTPTGQESRWQGFVDELNIINHQQTQIRQAGFTFCPATLFAPALCWSRVKTVGQINLSAWRNVKTLRRSYESVEISDPAKAAAMDNRLGNTHAGSNPAALTTL